MKEDPAIPFSIAITLIISSSISCNNQPKIEVMKIIKFCLFPLLLLFVVSCSKDDDNPGADASLVQGEWNFEEFTYTGTTTASQGGQTITTTYSGEAFDLDASVILNNAGNFSTAGSYVIKLTTTAFGQTTVQDHPVPDISAAGTYKIEGNKLITTTTQPPNSPTVSPMATAEGMIVELTANRMILTSIQEINTTMQGAQVQIRNETYQVFSR